MLKGISPLLSPDLLKCIAEMGHGDTIVIGDGNFPAAANAKRLIRLDGHGVPDILDALLQLFPLDTYVDAPVSLMAVTPGDPVVPVIWDKYRAIVESHQPGTKFEEIERFAFYDAARGAYAIIATGETALYANLILRKGVVTEPGK